MKRKNKPKKKFEGNKPKDEVLLTKSEMEILDYLQYVACECICESKKLSYLAIKAKNPETRANLLEAEEENIAAIAYIDELREFLYNRFRVNRLLENVMELENETYI